MRITLFGHALRADLPLRTIPSLRAVLSVLLVAGAVGAQEQPSAAMSDSLSRVPSPSGAFWRSVALPGWGQWYNGHPVKGGTYGGIVVVCAGMAARNWDRAIGTDEPGSLFWKPRAWTHGRNNWLILGGLTYILCAVEAYVDAHLQTFDVSPLALRLASDPDGTIIVALAFPIQ